MSDARYPWIVDSVERDDWIRGRTADGLRVVAFSGCARCGTDEGHELAFAPFERPVVLRGVTFGWWATCPATGEPILLTTFSLPDDDEADGPG